MKKIYYFIGFFIVLCFISATEYFLSPPQVFEGDTSFYEEEISSPLQEGEDISIIKKYFLDAYFQKSGISITRVEPSSELNHLFHLFPFSAEKNDFRVFSTTYLLKNAEGKNEEYAVVYDIFSTKSRTILEAYADIKNIIQEGLEGDVEKKVVEHNMYGQKSFSLKSLEPQGKVMYLVVAYRDRLLGIEYDFSRHDEMEKVFTQLFQTP